MLKRISELLSKVHPLEMLFRGGVLGIGMLFFAFALWQATASIQIIGTYDKYKAEVKRCYSDGSPNTRFKFYECEVKYRSADGLHSASIDKLLLRYDEGEQVDIYFSRGEQYSVHAGGFGGLWAIPTLQTIIGAIFVVFGLWPSKKQKR